MRARLTVRRGILFLSLAAGIAAFLTWWLWPRPRLNLLLVTLDTTRADRLGCYGDKDAATPMLDALAAQGVLCERADTVAPSTLPAHTSLFTGLYPAENGVRTNGRARLDDAIPTLARVLEQQGYETGGFVASYVLNRKFGLNQGFQTYDDDFAGADPTAEALHRQRTGSAVVDAALEWLGRKHQAPTFCWVHLYDPHQPYLSHADLFGDQYAERPYDAEIAYVDRQTGRLIDFLKARGLEQETIVVVVGDHGEGFGEHAEFGHGQTLYQEVLRVPLIFRSPGRLPAGKRVDVPISLVDVSPTILELLGISDRRRTTGRSMASALRGEEIVPTANYGATDDPFLSNGWSPLRSLNDGRWKYIRTTRVELYDLANDPAELHDLAESEPEQRKKMAALMAEFEGRLAPRSEVEVQLSPAERQTLASLGYAAGATRAAPGDGATDRAAIAELPDVKDMLPLDRAADEADRLIVGGNVDAGIARLREIVQKAPGLTKAYWNLAFALRKKGELNEASAVFQKLLDARPHAREAHQGLGILALDEGRIDDAIAEFRQTVDIDPDFADVHYNLAVAYLRKKKPLEALSHLNQLLEIDTFHAKGYDLRGDVLAGLGRKDEAIADYQRALKYGVPKE